MPDIVQTWKSVLSHKINKMLARKGVLWQSDYYNHIIRTRSEYANQVGYVLRNNMVLARQFEVGIMECVEQGRGGLATSGVDVARAPSPLQGVVEQGRGGLATSGVDVARAPSPLQTVDCFPGKDKHLWPDIDAYQGEILPRWSMDHAVYHICFRLADSVPQSKLREWEMAREEFRLRQRNGEVLSDDELRELKNLYSENVEKYLDSGYGECLLRKSGVADVIVETLLHDNGKAYHLHACGIMPNHVHVIVEFGVEEQGRGGLATSGVGLAALGVLM